MKPLKIGCYVPAYNNQTSTHVLVQSAADRASCANAGHHYTFWSNHSCDLLALRNAAAVKAVTEGFDYLLMQDADVYSAVKGGPLIRLLATAQETKACVTGALVTMRTHPPKANARALDGSLLKPGSVFEVSKMGSGMILIDVRQIRAWWGVSYMGPLFDVVYESYTHPQSGATFEPKAKKAVGMDVWFTELVRKHKMTVWCDARIPTSHVDSMYSHDYDGATIPIPDLAGFPGQTDPADPGNTATVALTGD